MEYTAIELANLEYLQACFKATVDGDALLIEFSEMQRVRFRLMGDDVNVVSIKGRHIYKLAKDFGFTVLNSNKLTTVYVNRKNRKITFLEFVVLIETLKAEHNWFKKQEI